MKLLLSIFGLSFLTISFVQAQSEAARISVGPEINVPIGDFSDGTSLGLGVSAFYEKSIKDKLTVMGGIGYTQWLLEGDFDSNLRFSMIPIQGGVKYDVTPKAYLQGLLGLHIFRASINFGDVRESESETDFGLGLGGGVYLTERLDLSGRFQIIDDANYFSVRLGYRF
jgi:Outer membrane protein beta-barrel domain